ncbi:extracellular catalytic domain type 1 short-chain-length polyhydroxyalkanoate depolymerase [Microtetraspora malaysiensis]|uniref:extracellular catalytic domain type 1 short-chain-length polyhydroxyalkanoate depolymerase n=1 Tax=Microtetraspora malaysiensis TaxID=161358 RepID=UPI003D8D7460
MRVKAQALGAMIATALLMLAGLVMAVPASSASLTEVTGFGTNPTNLRMHLYVPDRLPARPAVLVAIHYCTGSGPAFYSGTQFASLADQYGFIVIYPSATRSGSCFDVSSPQALRHDGASDPVGIVSMVRYVQQHYTTDTNRVYATGASSGAMMTNVLLGDYPDIFKAGSAFMGVPFGCFATTDGSSWNGTCANGALIKTPQQWGDLVRAAYPGYSGARPRMQVWHGTEDTTLRYPNLQEEVKQWTNVHGLGQTPALTDQPQPSWTRTRYGDSGITPPVEAISVQGVGHSLPTSGMELAAIRFLGLTDTSGPSPSPSPSASGSPSASPSASPTAPGPCRVTYTVNAWNTGFTANVTVTNTGSSAINGWGLSFTLPGGQSVTSAWNATVSPAGGQVTARNVSYNASIPPGGSTDFGFQGTHTGDTGKPAAFALNSMNCVIG